jgi:hypothetical protein
LKLSNLSFVLVRLLALYFVIHGLQLVVGFLFSIGNFYAGGDTVPIGNIYVWSSGLPSLVPLIGGILLWKFAQRIVSRIGGTQESSSEDAGRDIEASQIYVAGFILAGVVLALVALPMLVGNVVQLIQFAAYSDIFEFDREKDKLWVNLAVNTLKVLIAIVLILRADGLRGLIFKARELGGRKKEVSE